MALRREIALLQQIDTVAPIGRLAVIVVLLHLARRDYVAAEKHLKNGAITANSLRYVKYASYCWKSLLLKKDLFNISII